MAHSRRKSRAHSSLIPTPRDRSRSIIRRGHPGASGQAAQGRKNEETRRPAEAATGSGQSDIVAGLLCVRVWKNSDAYSAPVSACWLSLEWTTSISLTAESSLLRQTLVHRSVSGVRPAPQHTNRTSLILPLPQFSSEDFVVAEDH